MEIEDLSCDGLGVLPTSRNPVKHQARQLEPFLRGPVPIAWLARAASLRKPALTAGLCLWFQRGVKGSSGPIEVRAHVRRRLNISAGQMLRGLRALEAASLIRFEKSGRGRCPTVQIVDSSTFSTNGQSPPAP
ncbi:MAG: hypothetical protein EBT03_11245 [Betaproteobacteria bacterium]|nr:hypothetical protein [Betaproteobacteria bacterium]NCA18090.1 hypothetical protein [Betaproteobacteria bacterium]